MKLILITIILTTALRLRAAYKPNILYIMHGDLGAYAPIHLPGAQWLQ